MSQTKMTVKIYEPMLTAFDKQISRLCLKRDAFLDHMISIETPRLAEELDGRRLSAKARSYISGALKRLGTRTVNIVVDRSTADALKAVVESSNIVRDAFVNRLIMLLRSSDRFLEAYRLPTQVNWEEFKVWYEDMPTSPLGAMETVFDQPLYYLRLAVKERLDTGLYLLNLPEKFAGFSCYLADSSVPGTTDYEELSKMLLEDLAKTEANAFGEVAVPTRNGSGV